MNWREDIRDNKPLRIKTNQAGAKAHADAHTQARQQKQATRAAQRTHATQTQHAYGYMVMTAKG